LGGIPQEKRPFSRRIGNCGERRAAVYGTGCAGFESAFDLNVAPATGILTGRARLFCRM